MRLDMRVGLAVRELCRGGLAVRTARAAGLGAGAERLVQDLLDGAGAAAAFGAAAEAAIDLACRARQRIRGRHGGADIVVSQDVAGTNDHEERQYPVMLALSDIEDGRR